MPDRRTVDLSGFPDLAVIYLGMRVNRLAGVRTLLGFGPRIARSVAEQPDGLLLHESFLFSLLPMHVGMRQYWRDFESLERWARSAPHREWWTRVLRDSGGTGFWHETYLARGGVEAVYDDVASPIGLLRFAPGFPRVGRCSRHAVVWVWPKVKRPIRRSPRRRCTAESGSRARHEQGRHPPRMPPFW